MSNGSGAGYYMDSRRDRCADACDGCVYADLP